MSDRRHDHSVVKQTTTIVCNRGPIEVCRTVHQLRDLKSGRILMEEEVKLDLKAGDWFTQEMANELWNWKRGGFADPLPSFFTAEETDV